MEMTEIVELRKKMGLTQKDLAKMLGFDPWTVNRWETGKAVPAEIPSEKPECPAYAKQGTPSQLVQPLPW